MSCELRVASDELATGSWASGTASAEVLVREGGGLNNYSVEGPNSLWEDYGDILIAGMTEHLSRIDGLLQLERTGPFVPPISFPGIKDIIVTDEFRNLMESSGLSGFAFRPVILRHIVLLEWQNWNKQADEPEEYPASGEPEDYILQRPHSSQLAKQLEPLWEVVLDVHSEYAAGGTLYNWDGSDWFKPRNVGFNFVSEQARAWLLSQVPDWVSFRPILTLP